MEPNGFKVSLYISERYERQENKDQIVTPLKHYT